MNRVMKAATSVGAVALVLSGAVMAAPPAGFNASAAANTATGQFDNWSVLSGAIAIGDMDTGTAGNQDCPPGYTCGTSVTGSGFFQRQVTRDSDSASFFQTIIVDDAATATIGALDTLEFADESFVQTGNNQGLADKQRVSSVTGTVTFATSSSVNSGWAGGEVGVVQSVVDTGGDGFRTDFFFDQTGGSASPTQSRMKISGSVGLTATDDQNFVLVEISGDYNSGATTSATLAGVSGGTVNWTQDTTAGTVGVAGTTEGDTIKGIWVGQNMTAVNQIFGFTSFDNVTSAGNDLISEFSLTSSAPIGWDSANVWGANSLLFNGTGF